MATAKKKQRLKLHSELHLPPCHWGEEETLSGKDPSFNSVGERNPWSRSLKQCVFIKPEGEVGEVTLGKATGGLRCIQVFLQTNQKKAEGVKAEYHSTGIGIYVHSGTLFPS